MKKLIFITLLSLILMTSTACTTEQELNNNKNTETANLNSTKQAIAEENDEVVIEHLTAATFRQKVFDYKNNKEWKYEGDKPSIIDFYADWCQPCKDLAPILEELAQKYKGKVIFYKVDTEDERELAAAFAIRSIPSILFVPKEEKPQMAKGLLPKETIEKAISDILKVQNN